MNKGNKIIMILVIVGLIITSILAIYLSTLEKPDNNIDNSFNNGDEINTVISKLNDEVEFFTIQNVLNEFYDNIAKNNSSLVYSKLDSKYIKSNNINTSNVINKFNKGYETVSFVAKDIYYNDSSSITYYFVNGYVFNQSMLEETFKYEESVNYIVVVKNKNYSIIPLDNDMEISNLINRYNIVNRDVSNNKLNIINISLENKLTSYVTNFLNLLFLDTTVAYDLVKDDCKVANYNTFNNSILGLYEKLNGKIFSYSEKEIDNYKEYVIKNDLQNTFTIYEYGVMNYKICY